MNAQLTKVLLDFAAWTGWEWGLFAELNRQVNEHTWEYGDAATSDQLNLLRADTLTLIDVIPVEKGEALRATLGEAIPHSSLNQPPYDQDYRAMMCGTSHGARWSTTRSHDSPGGDIRLPNKVKRLDIDIWKLLPSFAVLRVVAELEETVTDDIGALAGTGHTTRFRIKKLGLCRPWLSLVPEDQAGTDLDKYVSALADAISACLGLTRLRRTGKPRLPTTSTILAYRVSASLATQEEIAFWIGSNAGWLESLGIETSPEWLYTSSSVLLCRTRDSWDARFRPAHHLLIFEEIAEREADFRMRAILAIESVSVALSFCEWTRLLIRDLENYRNPVFRMLESRVAHFRRSYRKYFELSEYIQWQTICGERLSQEISDDLAGVLVYAGVNEFASLNTDMSNSVARGLHNAVLTDVESQLKVLRTQFAHLHKAFSEFLLIRNMEVSYRLQRNVLILAVLALFIGLPTLWPAIKTVYRYCQKVVYELRVPPIIPFFFMSGVEAVIASFAVSIVAHFAVGAVKSLITIRSWWASGLEMTMVGVIEAIVTYGLGLAFGAMG